MTLLRSRTDCYHVIEELGRGTFGKVLKARKTETGQLVAIKVIKNDLIRSRVIKNEIKLLNVIRQVDLDESHLIRFFEHFHVQDTFYLVFELLQKNLYEYQKDNRFTPVPLRHIRAITTQVLEALFKLKELSIIHSDLKPENIVLVDHLRYPFRVKVIDFGSASILSEVKHVKEPYIQSRFYRAPEILLGLPFCEKLDMWSLGCIIAELHFGFPLYPGKNEYDQIRYICETQGLPDNYLLNAASKALFFFKYKVDTQRKIQWSIKTEEEYQLATKGKPVERRKIILKSLDEIEVLYTPKSCYPELEVLTEHCDLRNMVELMKRMLTWDSNKRINPNTAIKHPFISLQNLKIHYRNTKYYQLSKQCQYDTTQPEPQGRSYGLQPPNYYHSQIMNDITDGEEVEKMIEQTNGLHIEAAHLKVTDEARYHEESASHEDLPHLQYSKSHTEVLYPKSRRETVATPAVKYGNEKIAIINRIHSSPSKSNFEDHTTLKKPEESPLRKYNSMMGTLCAGFYSICLTTPLYRSSKVCRCVRLTRVLLSVLQFLAFMSRMVLNVVVVVICTSDYCIQSSKTALLILEWLALFASCTGHILLYWDFQLLTIRFRKSLKEDWIILRDDMEEKLHTNEELEPDPEKVGP